MPIGMRAIEAFLAVAEELHFGRAAEREGLSTSRISFLVRSLERRVGVALFERTSRRVRLTTQGDYLFAELRSAYIRMERALDAAAGSEREGGQILRVGFSTTLPDWLAPTLTSAFERRCPRIRVVRSDHPSAEMLRWLSRDWNVDTFVTWLPGDPDRLRVPGLVCGPPILTEQRAVALAREHPLAGRAEIDIEELADHEVLYGLSLPTGYANAWTPPFTPAGKSMRLRQTAATYVEEALRMVAQGGVGHLSFPSLFEKYRVPGIVLVPVAGVPPMTVAAVWPSSVSDPHARTFAEGAVDLSSLDRRRVPEALARDHAAGHHERAGSGS